MNQQPYNFFVRKLEALKEIEDKNLLREDVIIDFQRSITQDYLDVAVGSIPDSDATSELKSVIQHKISLPMRKILLLAANPTDSMRRRLDEEVRDIREGLNRAQRRDDFEITQGWAVRPRDLQRAMLEKLPQIVHFSGHAEGDAGLYFEDDVGAAKLVTDSALASLFRLFSERAGIECVVLNGCYSQSQAIAISEHVPYVVGMRQEIDDRAAIEFSVGFYDALGNGESVEFAFEAGKVAMELHSTGYEDIPVLITRAVVG